MPLQKTNYRLPKNYLVEKYQYKQTPDFHTLTFQGEETIIMQIVESSKELIFNASGLAIQFANFITENGKTYAAKIRYNPDEERVIFSFDEELIGYGKNKKRRIISILGLFKEDYLLDRTLHFALPTTDSSAPKADAFRVITSVWKNPDPNVRKKVWSFTKDNWATILEIYGESQKFLPLFITPAEQFHSEEDANEIAEFFKKEKAPGAERTIQQVIEMVISKADWLERDRNSIARFLHNFSEV